MINAKIKINFIKDNYDIIYVFQPSPVFQISPAIRAQKKFNAKLVVYCCDQWPESLKARGMNENFAYKIIAYWTKKLYQKTDYIINASPSFIEYNNRINKIDLSKMNYLIQHAEDCLNNLDLTKKNNEFIDLLFAGNVGKVQNVEDIIKAYNLLKYNYLRIHIVGSGSNLEKCKTMVAELNLSKNIIFYWYYILLLKISLLGE